MQPSGMRIILTEGTLSTQLACKRGKTAAKLYVSYSAELRVAKSIAGVRLCKDGTYLTMATLKSEA